MRKLNGCLIPGTLRRQIEHIPAEYDPRERYTRDRAYIESQLWADLSRSTLRTLLADTEFSPLPDTNTQPEKNDQLSLSEAWD